LYDTHESHYVTLQALAALVRSGEDFQVVDHGTNRDLTTATLAQIISRRRSADHAFPPRSFAASFRAARSSPHHHHNRSADVHTVTDWF